MVAAARHDPAHRLSLASRFSTTGPVVSPSGLTGGPSWHSCGGRLTGACSLGAVLAFAATGEGPFGAGSTPALVYRVVYSPPSLDRVSAEVRPLVERCLAKDPGQRPTARDLLAGTGADQPAAGWLPEPVTRTFIQLPTLADASRTVTSVPAALSLIHISEPTRPY